MRWWPVFRREAAASAQSPSLCIFAALFFALVGLFFNQALMLFVRASQGDPRARAEIGDVPLNINDFLAHNFFGILFTVLLLAVPLLTMRLIAEERKLGTLDLLLSYPLREGDVVIGKFLGAWLTLVVWLVLSLLYPVLMWWLSGGQLEILPLAAAYFGLICAGAAFVAIGLLASSLTENQLVAGLLSLGLLLLSIVVGSLAPESSAAWGRILHGMDMFEHIDWSLRGVLRAGDFSYFAVVTVTALFLAQRALSFRRLGVIR
jgi:ABC-2 type transport system permease protein